jgi:hypothetical protein
MDEGSSGESYSAHNKPSVIAIIDLDQRREGCRTGRPTFVRSAEKRQTHLERNTNFLHYTVNLSVDETFDRRSDGVWAQNNCHSACLQAHPFTRRGSDKCSSRSKPDMDTPITTGPVFLLEKNRTEPRLKF